MNQAGAELWQLAQRHDRAAACWRLPDAAHAAGIVCYGAPEPRPGDAALHGDAAGFLFYPFDVVQDQLASPALFLPADFYFDGQQVLTRTEAAAGDEAAWVPAANLAVALALAGAFENPADQARPLPFCADETFYQQLVAEGVAAIRVGKLQKVVASRAAVRPLPAGFEAWTAFERLQELYPSAFVSLVRVPGQGIWLGATPEVLAALTPTEIRTVALAGTQPAAAAGAWGAKETEEQNVVADYIEEVLTDWQLADIRRSQPTTVAAGPLLHRRTEFRAALRRTNGQPLHPSWLVFGLHPTPAVAGQPQQEALEFLRQHEGYGRRYYSGFLGPVNLPAPGTAQLFVNLRCAELRPDAGVAVLYAGAGLTADSDPAREWQETELKLAVVGAALG